MKTLFGFAAALALGCSGIAGARAAEADGAPLYMNHCAACHGARGEGDGPIAPLLTVTVPNLRGLSKRNGGTFPTDAVKAYIDGRNVRPAHGNRAMPVWGDVFRAATVGDEPLVATRIAVLVAFIEELQYR
ncbi:MAG TPA: cytochrome c [Gammaproteobacteria bacterium]|nr:cytochrome c [Gammaproteobacteria bacterium]